MKSNDRIRRRVWIATGLALMLTAGRAGAKSTILSRASQILAQNQMESGVPPMSQQAPIEPPAPSRGNELQIPPQSGNAATIPRVQPSAPQVDQSLSDNLTAYLRSHRLPFVTGQVFHGTPGTTTAVTLTGQVATEFGKHDAERKTQKYLGNAKLTFNNQIKIEPKLAQIPNPAPHQGGELKLPSVFKGCWRLANDQQDGPVRLLPGATVGCVYTHNSGKFCYEKSSDGSYEPTFSSFRLKRGLYGRQHDEWSRLEVLSTDAVSSARMRFILHHVEESQVLPFFLSANDAIDETHEFSCRVDGDRMHCVDQEFGRYNGNPWCEATHIDEFVRIPG